MRTTEASKFKARVKRIAGSRERRAAENSAKANVDIAALELIDVRAPRGRRGRHVRTECAAKARNRSRVALALPHSEGIAYKPRAVKSRCAREWDGWGRLSDDGPGQNNPVPSEGPWGGGDPT